jgi:hypothetical protein
MMKTLNATMNDFIGRIEGKKLYIYGIGKDYLDLTCSYFYPAISRNITEFIDNGKAGSEIVSGDRKYTVKNLEYLKNISEGIILICSSKCMDEMYESVCNLNLPDSVECFLLALIWPVSDGVDDSKIKDYIFNNSSVPDKIEKKIHCFWFSGDEKPKKYQMCIDSWKRVCPDYEIIEWNADNYDCGKNTFVKQAYDKKKWAFISDYARLDVVHEYGGIYLDMDVELKKDFEPLLKCDAFFSFGRQFVVDLGTGFGSVAHNPFIKSLLDLYQGKEFLDESGEPMLNKYVQPFFIMNNIVGKGVCMNGDMQMVDDMVFLPRKYYSPVDDFFFQNYVQSEDTRGIHWYNAGWCDDSIFDVREKNKLWIDIANKMV